MNIALEKGLEHNISLFIIDSSKNAIDIARRKKEEKRLLNIPVLLVSSTLTNDFFQIDEIKNGTVDFIIKPVRKEILIGKVNLFLKLQENIDKIESEKKFRLLAENAKDMIYRMSFPSAQYEYVSPSSFKLTGYTPEEFYANSNIIFDSIHSDCIDYIKKKLENLLNGIISPYYEFKFIHKITGEVKWAHQRNAGVYDKTGDLIAVECIVSDITQKKELELDLIETKGKLNGMLHSIPDQMSMMDRQLNITWVNNVAKKLFGNDLIGRKCFKVYHGLEKPCRNCLVLKTFIDKKQHVYETEVISKDGKKYTFECISNVALTDKFGNPTDVIGLSRNITKQKISENKLIEKQSFLDCILDQSPYPTWISDLHGTMIRANPALKNLLNLKDEQLIGEYNALKDPQVKEQGLLQIVKDALEKGKTSDYSLTWNGNDTGKHSLKDAKKIHCEGTIFPIINKNGKITNAVITYKEISDRIEVEKAIKKEILFSNTVIQSLPGLFYIFEENSARFMRRNGNWTTVTGYSKDELDLLTAIDIVDDKKLCIARMQEVYDKGSSSMENLLLTKSGEKIPYFFTGARFLNNGKTYLVGVAIDLSERTKIEKALHESEEHYKNFFDNALVGLFRTRISDGMYISMNSKAAEQQGTVIENIVGKIRAVDQYKNKDQRNELLTKLKKFGEVHDHEVDLICYDGREMSISISVKAYPEKDYMEGAVIEITERKNAEKQLIELNNELKHMVFRDALTGVINRNPFKEFLNKKIANCKRNGQKLAILFMDLENFKQVNDLYGHDMGDFVLIQAAKKIDSITRENDLLGRIGGDEFVLCLDDIKSIDEVMLVANKINNAFTDNIKIYNSIINLTVSIGIAFFPEHGTSADELLKNSDIAMYIAKRKQRNTYQIYDLEHKDEIILEQALLKALDNNEFYLTYQPIVNSNGKCVFIEALCRWDNYIFGSISPTVFIPLLENNKDICHVGKWIFGEACKKINSINKHSEYKDIAISVNLSSIQVEALDFLNSFKHITEEIGVNSNNIIFEITEEKKIDNVEKISTAFTELKKEKFGHIALDDFGSGYSSLSNLIKLPIDIVKIDKFLIDNLKSLKYKDATLDMISLIKKLNLKVVAEGVETEEQFKMLEQIGCDYFQGYYFSKPVTNILEAIKENRGVFQNKQLTT